MLDDSVQLGLGAIVDRDGVLGAIATATVIDALSSFIARARAAGASRVVLLGTEPFRRAADRDAAVAAIRAATGLRLRVLSSEAEGRLAWAGATGGHPVTVPTLLADIGGGSTEIVLEVPGGRTRVRCVRTGSARLARAVPSGDPPSEDEQDALRDAARRILAGRRIGGMARAITTGGTGTNVNRLLGRPRPATLTRADLSAARALLGGAPAAELAAATGLKEARVRQLPAGIALLDAILERAGIDRVDPSDASIREGALIAGPAGRG
jgi:exopolyphosphatase/guanosine-5'-triphosphate,3'-diphosphate pyrophosphatase